MHIQQPCQSRKLGMQGVGLRVALQCLGNALPMTCDANNLRMLLITLASLSSATQWVCESFTLCHKPVKPSCNLARLWQRNLSESVLPVGHERWGCPRARSLYWPILQVVANDGHSCRLGVYISEHVPSQFPVLASRPRNIDAFSFDASKGDWKSADLLKSEDVIQRSH